eukprot:1182200-Prorocentrum_minimum.AAC.4
MGWTVDKCAPACVRWGEAGCFKGTPRKNMVSSFSRPKLGVAVSLEDKGSTQFNGKPCQWQPRSAFQVLETRDGLCESVRTVYYAGGVCMRDCEDAQTCGDVVHDCMYSYGCVLYGVCSCYARAPRDSGAACASQYTASE